MTQPTPVDDAAPPGPRPAPPAGEPVPKARPHIAQLDGWRGISILFVLAAHLLPLGPKRLEMNLTVARAGMALFFTLSGYLITSFLMARPDPRDFLIRRVMRILPLAYAYLVIALTLTGASPRSWAANLLFLENYQTQYLANEWGPFWSLCVEIHFYLAVALLVAIAGRRGLWILFPACVMITAARVWHSTPTALESHLRADEILVGAWLALLGLGATTVPKWPIFRVVSPWVWLVMLAASASNFSGPLQYGRPYFAALLVGSTLAQPATWMTRQLLRPSLAYIASISYALYVIHIAFLNGYMNEGSTAVKYLVKRPISFVLLFSLAHLSTKYWEAPWIELARRWTRPKAAVAPKPVAATP